MTNYNFKNDLYFKSRNNYYMLYIFFFHSTSGLVNGLTFNKDTILLKYSNQTITGAKEFLPIYDQNSMASIYNHVLQINNLRIALLEAFLYDLVILNNDENGYSSFVFQGKGLKFTEQLNVRGKFYNYFKSLYKVIMLKYI